MIFFCIKTKLSLMSITNTPIKLNFTRILNYTRKDFLIDFQHYKDDPIIYLPPTTITTIIKTIHELESKNFSGIIIHNMLLEIEKKIRYYDVIYIKEIQKLYALDRIDPNSIYIYGRII